VTDITPSVILSHPFGNNNVKQAALALAEAELLEELWLGFSWSSNQKIESILPDFFVRELNRRAYPEQVLSRMHNYPWFEIIRLLVTKSGLAGFDPLRNLPTYLTTVCLNKIDQKVGYRIKRSETVNAVYAYNGSALETFRQAKKRNVKCIYEMASAHPGFVKEIYEHEITAHSLWARSSIECARQDKIDEELSYADEIIVASTFTKRTLDKAAEVKARIHTLPYGAPASDSIDFTRQRQNRNKLKVLYVGNLGLLKGIPYLLESARLVDKKIDLTLVGMPVGTPDNIMEEINSHTWISSLPNSEVLSLMRQHDVLVLPSLTDGFGLVILEALSQGLPVIATVNSGAPDVISEGEDGFIVPIRSAEAIAEKIDLLEGDRDLLDLMSKNAVRLAAELSWDSYRYRFVNLVKSFFPEFEDKTNK
jgi:glycosyltransferase involved in cell wall biosynthesis